MIVLVALRFMSLEPSLECISVLAPVLQGRAPIRWRLRLHSQCHTGTCVPVSSMTHRNWQSGRWCHLCQSMGRGHGIHGAQPAQRRQTDESPQSCWHHRWHVNAVQMFCGELEPCQGSDIASQVQSVPLPCLSIQQWPAAQWRKAHCQKSTLRYDPNRGWNWRQYGTLCRTSPSQQRAPVGGRSHESQVMPPRTLDITVPSQDSAEPLHEQGQ